MSRFRSCYLFTRTLLRWSELVVSNERVVRERLEDDPACTAMLLYDLEGELFFGAAPELDRCFEKAERRISTRKHPLRRTSPQADAQPRHGGIGTLRPLSP